MEITLDDIIHKIYSLSRVDQEKLLQELLRLMAEGRVEQDPVVLSQFYYEAFKQRLRELYPELSEISAEEARMMFEELTAKVREKLPFKTWQEAQAFMRGAEYYDFERQQYIHH